MANLANVIHVTSWLSRRGGGIPPVIWSLAEHTSRSGITCRVAGLRDSWLGEDRPADSAPPVTGNLKGPSAFGFAAGLQDQLRTYVQEGTVIHAHGLWMHAGVLSRRCSQQARCPRLVSPHGMLEPWALRNSAWKKRVAAWLFENRNLRSADCLHALCVAEAENFRRYGLRNPIAVIPNGVQLPPVLADRVRPEWLSRHTCAPKILLFLSRLHPKKGLEPLISTWAQLATDYPEWQLVIAGAGDPSYERRLHELTRSCHVSHRVTFLGPVYGADKQELLAAGNVFVLPSFSEGFSMAILEAAAAGLPVLLTPECNFPELVAAGAAVAITPAPAGLTQGLRQVLGLSEAERMDLGARGRALVQRSYTWPSITAQMCQVYRWLLAGGSTPDSVWRN